MSRSIALISIAVLVALALVVGVYTSAQGALLNTGANNEQTQVDAGVNRSLDRNRPTIDGADSSQQAPPDALQEGDGGCDHEAQPDPFD